MGAHVFHAFVLENRQDHRKVRVYARPWKIGDDPEGDGKWYASIQPIEHGLVIAERPLLQGYAEEHKLLPWALQFLKDALYWRPADTSDGRTLAFLLSRTPEAQSSR